VKELE
jgi:hypothetical protein